MKIKRFWLILLAIAVVIGVIALRVTQHRDHPSGQGPSAAQAQKDIYYCPMHPTYTSTRPGDCPICNMKLVPLEKKVSLTGLVKRDKTMPEQPSKEKKILYWTDPMIPGYKSDKPGKSPMGMEMVPVYEEAAGGGVSATEGYAAVRISPQKQQLIGVRTAPARRQKMARTIRTVGTVKADETRIKHVHPKVEGWIDEIFAKYEGDTVRKGQPLFSFHSPDFISAQREYLATLEFLDGKQGMTPEVQASVRANLEAARQRLLWWGVTEEQMEALEKSRTPSHSIRLSSPMDGVVLRKHVWPGEYMERGADFYHIADLSSVWVDIALYEMDLPLVSPGQEAVVEWPSRPGESLRGKLIYVAQVLNPETRTATARLELPNPTGLLRPDQYVTTWISVDLGEKLVVPSEAVLDSGTRQILFVDQGDGLLEPREVTVGVKGDGLWEIVRGVSEGEPVVVNGNFLVDSESRLKAALEGVGAQGHQHGQ